MRDFFPIVAALIYAQKGAHNATSAKLSLEAADTFMTALEAHFEAKETAARERERPRDAPDAESGAAG